MFLLLDHQKLNRKIRKPNDIPQDCFETHDDDNPLSITRQPEVTGWLRDKWFVHAEQETDICVENKTHMVPHWDRGEHCETGAT